LRPRNMILGCFIGSLVEWTVKSIIPLVLTKPFDADLTQEGKSSFVIVFLYISLEFVTAYVDARATLRQTWTYRTGTLAMDVLNDTPPPSTLS